MFTSQLLLGTLIILASVFFHVSVLVVFARKLPAISNLQVFSKKTSPAFVLLLSTTLMVIVIHFVEAWTWALIFLSRGEFTNIQDALYFSIVTITTLGYGDFTISPNSQLLASVEAMGGLILFGVSTAFLLGVMGHVFEETDNKP